MNPTDHALTIDTGLATCGWALTRVDGRFLAWGQSETGTGAKFEDRCAQHARAIIEAVEAELAAAGATLHSVHLEVSGEGAPGAGHRAKRGILLVNAVTMRLWHHLGEHWDWDVSIRPVHERERAVRGKDEAEVVATAAYELAEQGHDTSYFVKGGGDDLFGANAPKPIKKHRHAADAVLLARAVVRRVELLELAKGEGR